MSEDYYKILGIEKTSNEDEIKKAYRKQSLLVHPDRNKSPDAKEKFQKLAEAYECLSDPQKRSVYDKYGKEGLDGNHMNQNFDPRDLFSHIFGGNMGAADFFQGMFRERRTADTIHSIGVTLKDLYCGKTLKLAITRTVMCKACEAKGTKNKESAPKCKECKGTGVNVIMKQVNAFTIQQTQVKCNICNGLGECIEKSNECEECNASKMAKEKRQISIYIEPGMHYGEKFIFSEMSNEAPNMKPGALIFILEPKGEYVEFNRKGDDLSLRYKLSLTEALFGGDFSFKHLDNRGVHFSLRKTVVQFGDKFKIKGEGMPIKGNSLVKGDLYIHFDVKLPSNVDGDHITLHADAMCENPQGHILKRE